MIVCVSIMFIVLEIVALAIGADRGGFRAASASMPAIGHLRRQADNHLPTHSLGVEREETLQISARNTLQGKIERVSHGAVNTEVTVALQGGTELVSIITKVSADRLGLTRGKSVYVVIKASDVMIATE